MGMNEPILTGDAKSAIRRYMLKLIAVPGLIVAVLMFFLGYFIRDIAIQKAELAAQKEINRNLVEVTRDVERARFTLATQKTELDSLILASSKLRTVSNANATQLRTAVRDLNSDVNQLKGEIKRSDRLLKNFVAQKKDHLDALDALDTYPTAKDILRRLRQKDARSETTNSLLNVLTVSDSQISLNGSLRVFGPIEVWDPKQRNQRWAVFPSDRGGTEIMLTDEKIFTGVVWDRKYGLKWSPLDPVSISRKSK